MASGSHFVLSCASRSGSEDYEETLSLAAPRAGAVWHFVAARRLARFHRHVELEANLVRAGRATYLIGDRRYELTRGTLLWLFPRQEHLLVEASRDFEMWVAVWRPTFLEAVCPPALAAAWCAPLPPPELEAQAPRHVLPSRHESLDVLCQSLARAAEQTRPPSPSIEALPSGALPEDTTMARERYGLGWLFFEMWEAFAQARPHLSGASVSPAVERAALLLRQSNPPPGVGELARAVGLSASRLSRAFSEQMGVRLVEFRAGCCLERALLLMRAPEMDLAEIAARAGFGSYSQFHRVFRGATGKSPRAWRRAPGSNGQTFEATTTERP